MTYHAFSCTARLLARLPHAGAARLTRSPAAAAAAAAAAAEDIRADDQRRPGLPPKIAVPEFIALSTDAETVAAAKTIGEVLWDDLNFEREFYMVPRDTYRSIPAAALDRSGAARPLERARRRRRRRRHDPARTERLRVEVRLLQVVGGRSAFGKQYTGSLNSVNDGGARLRAHRRDEIHQTQRSLRGVARTKLALLVRPRRRRGCRGRSASATSRRSIAPTTTAPTRRGSPTPQSMTSRRRGRPTAGQIAYTSWRRGYSGHHRQSMIYRDARRRSRRTAHSERRTTCRPGRPTARDRVHVEPGRQPGDLLHEPRRQRAAARDEQPVRST